MKKNKSTDKTITAETIISTMLNMQDEKQMKILSRFFKTGFGEYGEGDKFLGIKVPQTRGIVKENKLKINLSEIKKMLYSEWHEVRLCALLFLAEEMKHVLPRKGVDNKDNAKKGMI